MRSQAMGRTAPEASAMSAVSWLTPEPPEPIPPTPGAQMMVGSRVG